MDILLLLPLLRGWEYDIKTDVKPFVIPKETSKTIKEYKVPIEACYGGWCLAASAAVNNKNAKIIIKYDIHQFELNPIATFALGLTKPNPWGFFMSVYDTTANLFAGHYMPVRPLWFTKYFAYEIVAPKDADLTVSTHAYTFIKISNMNEFRQSLKEVFGLELLKQILETLQKGGK